ncbi:MAG TPA: histidine kinase [Cellvibrionaceae bacterium]
MGDKLVLEQKMSWIYLINLGFYLLPLFMISYSVGQLALMLAAMLAFIACHFWVFRLNSEKMWRPVVVMLAIAISMTPLNPGTISMFAYTGFFIGFAYRLSTALLLLLSLCLVLVLLNWSLSLHWDYFLHYGLVLLVGIWLIGRAERARQQKLRRERRSTDEIQQLAAMVERERIARDLHDILGHSLSSIALKADLAERLLQKGQPEQAQLHLQQLGQIARDSLSQVRQSVSGYKHQGMVAEVNKLLERLRDAGFSAELQGDIPPLDSRSETALLLALTELVTNVLRHSKGNFCQLGFEQNADELTLSVTDNGQLQQLTPGNGLTGVTERLAALNASLKHSRDDGCRFSIHFPLRGQAK